jgi:hypothetical protein
MTETVLSRAILHTSLTRVTYDFPLPYCSIQPFQGLPLHSSYESNFHIFVLAYSRDSLLRAACHTASVRDFRIFPLPSSGTSHWQASSSFPLAWMLLQFPGTMHSTLKIETVMSSKTLVSYCNIMWHHNLEYFWLESLLLCKPQIFQ